MANTTEHISIVNTSRSTVVGHNVRLADTFLTRLFGLLGKRGINPGGGLLIKPSSGVHTFGMAFPIDIIALDQAYRVVGAWSHIGPRRIRGLNRRTRCILELPSGQIERSKTVIGDELKLESN
jgi:uncharacterized membrane protein (UPF0127 family)